MDVIQAVLHDEALATILLLTVLAGLLDLATGILAAIRTQTFTLDKLADYLVTHVLNALIPIAAVSVFASVASAAVASTSGVPAEVTALVTASWAAAWGGLLLYLGSTLASLGVNVPKLVQGTPEP